MDPEECVGLIQCEVYRSNDNGGDEGNKDTFVISYVATRGLCQTTLLEATDTQDAVLQINASIFLFLFLCIF